MKNDAYQIAYRTITSEAARSERSSAFGDDDIGQHSWTTPKELLDMISACELNERSVVMDVGCGAGGPAMFVAQQSGCQVTGVDIDDQGIEMANAEAIRRGLSHRCRFQIHNAADPFDFPDASFDLIFAIDSIFHIPQRENFLTEARRMLTHRGKLFFTDAGVVNGQISGEEFQLRSFNGAAYFAPAEYNKSVLEKTGFEVISSQDLTESNEKIAQRRFDARIELRDSLVEVEGEVAYRGRQAYLHKVAELCHERRLCRYAYLAKKGCSVKHPGNGL
ncbi:MAG: methyltransferase domain-containing protein [Gammaproteobacteria bacterium]|nr:methyltransferase domain-containing protein [Gammaproteobacteria bacterium]